MMNTYLKGSVRYCFIPYQLWDFDEWILFRNMRWKKCLTYGISLNPMYFSPHLTRLVVILMVWWFPSAQYLRVMCRSVGPHTIQNLRRRLLSLECMENWAWIKLDFSLRLVSLASPRTQQKHAPVRSHHPHSPQRSKVQVILTTVGTRYPPLPIHHQGHTPSLTPAGKSSSFFELGE